MTPGFLRSILRLLVRNRPARAVALAAVYALVLSASVWMAFQLRFDFDVPFPFREHIYSVCATAVAVQLLCLAAFHQFDGLLSYFSTPDLKRLIAGCSVAALVLAGLRLAFGIELAPPRGVLLIDYVFSVMALSATRITFRSLRLHAFSDRPRTCEKRKKIAIVGAGDSGAALAKDLLARRWLGLQPVAFFDDHLGPLCSLHGIPVVGRPERIAEFRRNLGLDEIIIAMPSAPAKRVRDVVKVIRQAGLTCRTVPSLDQLATGRVSLTNLRPVQIEDLLGRDPVQIAAEEVREILRGKTVMVTGAGGSIGSELCRQIIACEPDTLLLLERSEPQLFVIEQELRGAPQRTALLPLVGDIKDRARMGEIFRRFRPDVIFHAAAHKHVPLMELQPDEAIRNNVFGTATIAELAIEHGIQRFVLISTDKAVNPTSTMGATKRLAEIHLQSLMTRQSGTKFMAVRFGNVLGSSGSVVPTFSRQIAAGGPVTVTHPEMTRFFMTIPEAASLVLQSSAFGRGGDIFVLDMGQPVKILDLARHMIELSGFKPHDDIEITFTGLRPGEKLYEELTHGREDITPTGHPKIARLVSQPQHHTYVAEYLNELDDALSDGVSRPEDLKNLLAQMIPEYTPFVSEHPPLPAPSRRTELNGTANGLRGLKALPAN